MSRGSWSRNPTALALGLAVVLLGACGSGNEPSNAGPDGQPQTPESALLPTTAPRARDSFARAFADGKLLVFGGEVEGTGDYVDDIVPPKPTWLNDGALYDVATNQWLALPDAPFDRSLDEPEAVGVGNSFVVIGVDCPKRTWDDIDDWSCDVTAPVKGAIYETDTRAWRSVELPASAEDWWAIGALGTEAAFAISGERVLLVDPATGDTRTVARPPFDLKFLQTCVGDERVTAVRVSDERDIDVETDPLPLRLDGVALDASARAWSSPVTFTGGTAPSLFGVYCAGHTAVVVPSPRRQLDGRDIDSFTFDGETWRTIASPPVDLGLRQPSVWTGSELVIWGGAEFFGDHSARAYRPSTDTWRKVEQPLIPDHPLRVWTGADVLLYYPDPRSGDAVSRVAVP